MNKNAMLKNTLAIIALLLLTPCIGAASDDANAPNILFIFTDDQSHRTVSAYEEAYDWVKTPNIDRLATHGTRFADAYVGTWCMPSRASMLTGLQPYGFDTMRMTGDYPGSTYDPEQLPFWPSVFRESGYVTAQIGKWHTGTDTGAGRDWDYQVVWNRPRHRENAGNYFDDQLIETNGADAELTKGYTTDRYTDLALDFINGSHRDPDKPWYLWLCYSAVHSPYTPAQRHLEAFPDMEIPTPADIYPPRPGKPTYMQEIDFWEKGPDGQPVMKGGGESQATTEGNQGIHGNALADWVRQYHQGVLAIDEGVGRLIKALEESGQLENTLVVFTSDQGFAWGQHGFSTKLAPYDANLRSPLIVSMPGTLPQGVVNETPVGGVDLIPTFFNFAGLDLPWKMHGNDLTPMLNDPEFEWPHPVLLTLTGSTYGSDTDLVPYSAEERKLMRGIPWWVSLREGRYKYIRTLEAGEVEELYDIDADPEELTNLALDRNHADRLARMRQATIAELRRTDAGMADHLPPVRVTGSE
jgi:arylsulfatase A-like enzyme